MCAPFLDLGEVALAYRMVAWRVAVCGLGAVCLSREAIKAATQRVLSDCAATVQRRKPERLACCACFVEESERAVEG